MGAALWLSGALGNRWAVAFGAIFTDKSRSLITVRSARSMLRSAQIVNTLAPIQSNRFDTEIYHAPVTLETTMSSILLIVAPAILLVLLAIGMYYEGQYIMESRAAEMEALRMGLDSERDDSND